MQSKSSAYSSQSVLPKGSQEELEQLKKKISEQNRLDAWLAEYSKGLGTSGKAGRLKKYMSIQQSRMQFWESKFSEPDKAEQEALNYLKGVKGFEKALNTGSSGFNDLTGKEDLSELKNLGYQTKTQLNDQLS